jgi:hypothetical protein
MCIDTAVLWVNVIMVLSDLLRVLLYYIYKRSYESCWHLSTIIFGVSPRETEVSALTTVGTWSPIWGLNILCMKTEFSRQHASGNIVNIRQHRTASRPLAVCWTHWSGLYAVSFQSFMVSWNTRRNPVFPHERVTRVLICKYVRLGWSLSLVKRTD